jgi:hypothetical protein
MFRTSQRVRVNALRRQLPEVRLRLLTAICRTSWLAAVDGHTISRVDEIMNVAS